MIIQSEEFSFKSCNTGVIHFIGLNSLPEENYNAMSSTAYNKGKSEEVGT